MQVIADGTDSNSTERRDELRAAARRAVRPGAAAQRAGLAAATARRPSRRASACGSIRSSRAATFMIPGIVAMLLLVITTNLSSMALVRENGARHARAAERHAAGAVAAHPRQAAAVRAARHGRRRAGRVSWRLSGSDSAAGSPLLLFACCLIYLLTTLGLGLFISTVSETQQQSMMTATFFFLTPMLYLSGFIFPIENMPAVIQKITYLVPAPLLHHHRPRHLPEGRGCGRAVAGDSGSAGVGPRHHRPRRPPIAKDHGIGRGNLFWVH